MITFHRWGVRVAQVYFNEDFHGRPGDLIEYTEWDQPVDGSTIRPFYTILIDLQKTEDELFADMRKKTRQKIRRAQDTDFFTYEVWRPEQEAVLRQFIEFYDRFAAIKRLPAIQPDHVQRLRRAKAFDLSVVKSNEGEPLVWHAYYLAQGRACQIYTASLFRATGDKDFQNLVSRANSFHHWSDMVRFKQAGLRTFDLGGWYEGSEDQERLGVNNFKEGFGGTIVTTYNCVLPATLKGRLAWRFLQKVQQSERVRRFYQAIR